MAILLLWWFCNDQNHKIHLTKTSYQSGRVEESECILFFCCAHWLPFQCLHLCWMLPLHVYLFRCNILTMTEVISVPQTSKLPDMSVGLPHILRMLSSFHIVQLLLFCWSCKNKKPNVGNWYRNTEKTPPNFL